jgi:lipooligosaccharide transport system permease protein
VQILVGLAFATPVYGLSAGLKDEMPFALVFRLGVIPMFLFSGAFFPIENLSPWMEQVARLTPLWHGVDLTRMLTLDQLDASSALIHLAYLGAVVVLGYWWATRRLTRRLVGG